MADLAICLAKHPEFNFDGIQSKLILIHSGDNPINRDVLLTTIEENSATNPLIAFINPSCVVAVACVVILDAKQLENFQVACETRPLLST